MQPTNILKLSTFMNIYFRNHRQTIDGSKFFFMKFKKKQKKIENANVYVCVCVSFF